MILGKKIWIFLKQQRVWVALLGIVALVMVVSVYVQHKQPNQTTIPSTSPNTSQPTNTDKQPASSNQSSDRDTTNEKSGSPGAVASTLLKPSGTFVSNHHPNISGSPAPSTEQSVCNTSPGARCTITFTKGNSTKSLNSQVADATGATYWTWDVKDAGFTPGSWQITAVATLGDQTLSTSDSLTLEVGP
ncbi:hypothetical protein HY218_01205 [Candidatus Saccharibacteria bacterium]|nr:hypothetical protein [Candidatus Saccharibacteria bacterium]